MAKYFAIATVIVLAIAVFSTAWVNRDLIRIKIGATSVPMAPRPGPTEGIAGRKDVPFRADAPWALSALPECFMQDSISTGPRSYVRAHVPPGATPVVPPATLDYGDCTISVAGAEAYVRRGEDRFRIPGPVQFFRGAGTLAVMRTDGKSGELRVYSPVH